MAKDDKVMTDDDVQVVAFKLRNEEYGFSILNVQEIKGLTDITRVPFAPDFIKGVINLRGSVLPVIDLKKRLGLEDTPYTANTRIVIVQHDEVSVGMLVDAVTEVRTISAADIDTTRAITSALDNIVSLQLTSVYSQLPLLCHSNPQLSVKHPLDFSCS